MMIFAVGRWLWHLSVLHHFHELVDKIAASCGAWVMEVETCRPRLIRCPMLCTRLQKVPLDGSVSLKGWPADGPLVELDVMSFPLGSAPWVQTPDNIVYLSSYSIF
jgi:hypothetical protein